MIPVDRWEVVYGDGSRFTSSDGTWAEAPPFGVFAVVYHRVDGTRLVQMEQDHRSRYEWSEHVPYPDGAVEVEGVEAGGKVVKWGLWVSNDAYFTLTDAIRGEVTP